MNKKGKKIKSTKVSRSSRKTNKVKGLKKLFPLIAVGLLLLAGIPMVLVLNQSSNTFLRAATVTYTAGVTTVGSKKDSGNQNGISSTQVTTGANSGMLSSISVYIGKVNSQPRNHMQVAIYSDNGLNAPGTLIANSGSIVISANKWNTFTMSSVPINANSKYWLAFNVDGSNTQYAIASATTPRAAWKIPTTYGSWPNPMGNLSEPVSKEQYSIYMTYAVQVPTPTPTITPTPIVLPTATPTIPPSDSTPTPTPTTGPSTLLFNGDYETGNASQWDVCQSIFINSPCSTYNNNHYSIQVQNSVVRQGNYAARFELRDGDCPVFGNICYGERTEVQGDVSTTGGREGDDRWYQWSTQFTTTFPDNHETQGWGLVNQWHAESDGSPPVGMYVDVADGQWGLRINRQSSPGVFANAYIPWKTSIAKGTWQDIKMHIKWSTNDSVGFVELWHNGVRQTFTGAPCAGLTRCTVRTLVPGGGGSYYKQGYYRYQGVSGTGVVYHDGFTAATTESGLGNL